MSPGHNYEWNHTEVEYPREKTIARLFAEQVVRTPDAIAIVSAGQRLTYSQLDVRTNQLAHYLQAAGVGPGTLAGVAIERSNDMLIAMLAILKAGGAYLPLDPHYPIARIAMVVEDSGIPVLLTTERNRGNLPASGARIISLDDESKAIASQSSSPVTSSASAGDLAYVIYTSGSMGKPKGVMIEHRNVVNFFAGMDRVIGPEPGIWLALTSFSFDISVLELLWTLTRGFLVVIHPDDSAGTIPGEILRHGVTHLQSTPSLARLFTSDQQSLASLGSLKKLLLGGEALPASLVDSLRQSVTGEIFNMYGPTETTVWSTTYRIKDQRASIPIGKPIANTQVYVLDSQLRPVPAGEAGDLYIGGDGVVRGYWNRPELTAERFIPDPFRNGGRLYRTGDIARFLPDGNLEFLGRADFQVKIRGFRIELGEIEAALEQQPGVRQAVVVAGGEKSGDKRLAAYVVAKAGESPAANSLRAALESTLPDYMVPSHFVFLESLPLTANGKIDRKSLPAVSLQPVNTELADDPPQDEIEQRIAQVWAEVLGAGPIRRNDNFFDLGGHSLSALQIAFKLREMFNVEFPLQTFIKTPTIKQLAEILRSDEHSAAWSCLVPFQANGSRPPLFCVHGHTGEVLFYRDLARNLGPDQPFYALQAHGLTGGEAHLTIEEMAMDYLREVRAVQPRGPYFLAGYCFGGRIAFEMAQQLREQGEEVAFLAVFDTYFPARHVPRSLKRLHRWLDARAVTGDPFLERMRSHLAQLGSLEFKEQFAYLTEHGRNAMAKTRLRLNHWSWGLAYRYHTLLGQPLPRRLQNVPEINLLAAVKYKPRRLAGHLTLLLNGPVPEGFSPEPEFGWRGMLADKFDVLAVPGKQDGMFKDPSAIVLAEKMAACIENACAQASMRAESANSDPGSQQEVPAAVLDSNPSGQLHQLH